MKRSQSVNPERMRIRRQGRSLSPLALALTASTLGGCNQNQHREVAVYRDIPHCIEDNPGRATLCTRAYGKAVERAARSGLRYDSETDCNSEFGDKRCTPYQDGHGHGWFIPAISGFLLARTTERNDSGAFITSPLYTSTSPYSPMYRKWVDVQGSALGRRRYGNINVHNRTFKSVPPASKTMSRGGFGVMVALKASLRPYVDPALRRASRSWGG